MIRLILLDPVPVCLYPQGQTEPDFDGLCYPYLIDPGSTEEDASWDSGGVVPNHNVTIENRAGEAVSLLTIPPRRARLVDDDGTLFEGTVGGIQMAETARIELIA